MKSEETNANNDAENVKMSLDPIIEKRTSSTIIRRRRKKAPAPKPTEEVETKKVEAAKEEVTAKETQPEKKKVAEGEKKATASKETEKELAKKEVEKEAIPESTAEATKIEEDESKVEAKAEAKETNDETTSQEAKTESAQKEEVKEEAKEKDSSAAEEKAEASEKTEDEKVEAKESDAKEPESKEKILDPLEVLQKKIREETNPVRRSFLESQYVAALKLKKQNEIKEKGGVVEDEKPKQKEAGSSVNPTEGSEAVPPVDAKGYDSEEEIRKKKARKDELARKRGNKNRQIDYLKILAEEEENTLPIEEEPAKKEVFIPRKSMDMGRGRRHAKRPSVKTQITTPKSIKTKIKLTSEISVADLAKNMNIKVSELIKKMIPHGMMLTANQVVDIDTATLIASEFSLEVENVAFNEDKVFTQQKSKYGERKTEPRPPVITVMGHVDHGKTTLLDSIRNANVVKGEAGGITQHIGAYTVVKDDKSLTFIDTPGHEAFSSMRARGAQCTDIVILVVAADDSVMPQTIESISHAKASEVPIIVAVNKIDRPNINIDKVYQELAEHEVISEEWGGDTIFCKVSALKGEGIDDLLSSVLLQAEMLELTAPVEGPAEGVIIESKMEKGRGCIATALVKEGILSLGDVVVADMSQGKIRAMMDHKGEFVETAGPSIPVEICGLATVPVPGQRFNVVDNEKLAAEIIENRRQAEQQASAEPAEPQEMSLELLFSQKLQSEDKMKFNVLIKADTRGSIEALNGSLMKLNNDRVEVKILHEAVGGINESDVILANTSGAVIIGFNVRADTNAELMAEKENILVMYHSIIYALIDEIKSSIEGRFAPEYVEKIIGKAEVRETFPHPKVGMIAGSSVLDGKIIRNGHVRLIRDNVVIYTGKVSSLRRFKDDVREVASGYECGLGLEKYRDIKVGDIVESYTLEETKAVIY